MRIPIKHFTGGEIDPQMGDKTRHACRHLENFIPQIYGNVERRPGTKKIYSVTNPITHVPTLTQMTYTKYFVGVDNVDDEKILYRINSDGTLDTDWGNNGGWGFTDETSEDATSVCWFWYEFGDGRILVAHNEIRIGADADQTCITMLTADGAIDTTWATNGHYVHYDADGDQYDCGYYNDILEDDDGNIYLFGYGSYNFKKLESDGTLIYAKIWDEPYHNPYHGVSLYSARWYDSNKSRIIVGCSNFKNASNTFCNMVAFNPDDGEIDTTWTGNLGEGGYANFSSDDPLGSTRGVVCIEPHLDGFLIFTTTEDGNGVSKILADGSDYDTTFGTNGHIPDGHKMAPVRQNQITVDDDNNIWTLARNTINGLTQQLRKWDSDGTLLLSKDFVDTQLECANNFILFNDYVIIAFRNLPSTDPVIEYQINRFNKSDLTYVDGFDSLEGESNPRYLYMKVLETVVYYV